MIHDKYPSRGGRKAELVNRQDPVVYKQFEEGCPLTKEQLESYSQNGFIILEDVFKEEDVLHLRDEIDQLKSKDEIKQSEYSITEPESGEVRSIFLVHEISDVFKQLASHKYLKSVAEYILNDKVYLHQSRINYKPGFKGKEFYWHSDFETWHIEDGMPEMRALSMSIVLTDNYSYNGALMLIPGSQNEYVVCEGFTPDNHFKSSLKKQEYGVPSNEILEKMVDKGGIKTATGKAGSVIVFDCNTMHGSNGNITPFPRSNVFFVYNALSNRVVEPFCNQPPRPEYICSRNNIKAL